MSESKAKGLLSKSERVDDFKASSIDKKRREKLGVYFENEEMFDDLIDVISNYAGTVSLVSTIGILDLVKDKVKENTCD